MSEFTEVGRLLKAHGIKGEFKCVIEAEYIEDVLKNGLLYVGEGSNTIPYFIESIRSRDPFLVKLDSVDTKEDAALIAHNVLKVKTEVLSRLIVEESPFEYHYIVGWKMMDKDSGEIGVVDRIEEYPQQEMAFITNGEDEFLVPLHDEIIKSLDRKNCIINVELPVGLLNMDEDMEEEMDEELNEEE